MPKKTIAPPKSTSLLTGTKMTVTKSLVMGIAIVAASTVITTFLAALLWPFMHAVPTPSPTLPLEISLNSESPDSQKISRFAPDFEFIKVDFKNNSEENISIKSLTFKKKGGVADKNIGALKLVNHGKVLSLAPAVNHAMVVFSDVNATIKPNETKTLSLLATLLSPSSEPEARVSFTLSGQDIVVDPPGLKNLLLTTSVQGHAMKVSSNGR